MDKCRICVVEEGKISIFSKEKTKEEESSLSHKIMFCTSVKMSSDDGLPKALCQNCLENLYISYNFKLKCEESDANLRKLLIRNSIDKSSLCKLYQHDESVVVTSLVPSASACNAHEQEVSTGQQPFSTKTTFIEEGLTSESIRVKHCESVGNKQNIVCLSDCNDNKRRNDKNVLLDSIQSNSKMLNEVENTSTDGRRHYTRAMSNSNNTIDVTSPSNFDANDDSKSDLENDKVDCINGNEIIETSEDFKIKHKIENIRPIIVDNIDNLGTNNNNTTKKNSKILSSDTSFTNSVTDITDKPLSYSLLKPTNGNYKCFVCSKSYTSRYQMHRHQITHYNKRQYTCDVCNKGFYHKGNLIIHQRIHTGERPYLCNTCGKSFIQVAGLQRHLTIHQDNKPYACSICCKEFRLADSLTCHMRTHTSEKPYKCKKCQKAFTHQSGLNKHVRIHTGEKKYNCHQCEKSFSRSDSLSAHVKTHTGERPHKCPHEKCYATFVSKSALRVHFRTHTLEKPYSCKYCGKSFSQSSVLHRHERTHTGERPYACQECDMKFLLKIRLVEHINRIHNKSGDNNNLGVYRKETAETKIKNQTEVEGLKHTSGTFNVVMSTTTATTNNNSNSISGNGSEQIYNNKTVSCNEPILTPFDNNRKILIPFESKQQLETNSVEPLGSTSNNNNCSNSSSSSINNSVMVQSELNMLPPHNYRHHNHCTGSNNISKVFPNGVPTAMLSTPYYGVDNMFNNNNNNSSSNNNNSRNGDVINLPHTSASSLPTFLHFAGIGVSGGFGEQTHRNLHLQHSQNNSNNYGVSGSSSFLASSSYGPYNLVQNFNNDIVMNNSNINGNIL